MIKEKIFRLGTKTIAGLECIMNSEQEVNYYNLVLLRKEQNSIKTLLHKSGIRDIKTIKKLLKPHIPLAIVINGKGAFYKKISAENVKHEEALNLALPGAASEDFCFQLSPAAHGTWISIIRIKMLAALCRGLEQNGYYPCHIDIGPLGTGHLYPFINGTPDCIDLCDHKLFFENGKITEVKAQDHDGVTEVKISREPIARELIPAFAVAVSSFLKINNTIHNTDLLDESRKKYHYTHLFRKTGMAALAFFLILLLFNTFLVFNLSKKNEAYSLRLGLYQKQLEQLKNLKDIREEKQLFVKQQNNLSASGKSFYADEIAATIPTGIRLEMMSIFPEISSRRKKNKEELLFEKNIIDVKGSSEVSVLLNEWINALLRFNWIEKVTLLPYAESENGVGTFELKIKIKDQPHEEIIH